MHLKDVRAIILLVMWELWKHGNAIMFKGVTPSLKVFVQTIGADVEESGTLKGRRRSLVRGFS